MHVSLTRLELTGLGICFFSLLFLFGIYLGPQQQLLTTTAVKITPAEEGKYQVQFLILDNAPVELEFKATQGWFDEEFTRVAGPGTSQELPPGNYQLDAGNDGKMDLTFYPTGEGASRISSGGEISLPRELLEISIVHDQQKFNGQCPAGEWFAGTLFFRKSPMLLESLPLIRDHRTSFCIGLALTSAAGWLFFRLQRLRKKAENR